MRGIAVDQQDLRRGKDRICQRAIGAVGDVVVKRDEPLCIRGDNDRGLHGPRIRPARRITNGHPVTRKFRAAWVQLVIRCEPADETGVSAKPGNRDKRSADIAAVIGDLADHLALSGRKGSVDIEDVVNRQRAEPEDLAPATHPRQAPAVASASAGAMPP